MEAPGVEPGSEDASERASTCVSVHLIWPRRTMSGILPPRRANLCVALRPVGGSGAPSLVVYSGRGLQAEARGHRRYLVINQAARATRLSFAVAVLPVFTWPRAPRHAARASTSSSKPARPLVREPGRWTSAHHRARWGSGQGRMGRGRARSAAWGDREIYRGSHSTLGRIRRLIG